VRVLSEHAIAGQPRLSVVTEVFQNQTLSFADTFMLFVCGLKEFPSKNRFWLRDAVYFFVWKFAPDFLETRATINCKKEQLVI
jgi:hypothetical protein